MSSSTEELQKNSCRIVVTDKIRGFLNWLQDWFKKSAVEKCRFPCQIAEKQNEIYSADVVIYHASSHQMGSVISPHKKKTPLRVLVSMEQPKYATVLMNKKYLEENFDLMMTYSMSRTYPSTSIPNLPITYFPLNIMSPSAVMYPGRPFKEKSGYGGKEALVAAFISNCKNAGASSRLAYLEELMKYISVHSYGKCLQNQFEPENSPKDPNWPDIAQRRARKIKILSHYKFYLAFENLAVKDYVSEKVFEGLFAGTLPVYRGTDRIHLFMPSNMSYINANDLTPRQLADKLNYLSTHEAEYNKYFAFKEHPLEKSFENMALMSYTHPNVLCRLCEYAMKHRGSLETGNRSTAS